MVTNTATVAHDAYVVHTIIKLNNKQKITNIESHAKE